MHDLVDAQIQDESLLNAGRFESIYQLNVVLCPVPIREAIVWDKLTIEFFNLVPNLIKLLQ